MKYIKTTPAKKKSTTAYQNRKWLWEFSKKIVVAVTVIFVTVFLFSCVLLCVYPDSTALQSMLDNISDVFKVTVVSYAVKAGIQNAIVVSKHYDKSHCKEEEKDEEEIYINSRGEDG